jgi:hypothetical protein
MKIDATGRPKSVPIMETLPLREQMKILQALVAKAVPDLKSSDVTVTADVNANVNTTTVPPMINALRLAFAHNQTLRASVEAGEHAPLPPVSDHFTPAEKSRPPNMKLVTGTLALALGHTLPDPSWVDAEFNSQDVDALGRLLEGTVREPKTIIDVKSEPVVAKPVEDATFDDDEVRFPGRFPPTFHPDEVPPPPVEKSPFPVDPPGRVAEVFGPKCVMVVNADGLYSIVGLQLFQPGPPPVFRWKVLQGPGPVAMIEHFKSRGHEEVSKFRGEFSS